MFGMSENIIVGYLNVDILGISGTTLGGESVQLVLSSVGFDGFNGTIISNEGNGELDNTVGLFK